MALYGKSVAELWSAPAIWDHIVTCHPAQMNMLILILFRLAGTGTRFIYPRGIEG